MTFPMTLVVLAALWAPFAAFAQSVDIQDAWIRGTVPAQKATGAFMQLTSKTPARLVGAASPAAGTVEIHNMTLENGVMRMFPVQGIDLPPGRMVRLAPGGYHVMLMELKRTLNAGERVPLTLTFELPGGKRESVELAVEVRSVKGEPARSHHHH
jgi:copper(I)-binding protein